MLDSVSAGRPSTRTYEAPPPPPPPPPPRAPQGNDAAAGSGSGNLLHSLNAQTPGIKSSLGLDQDRRDAGRDARADRRDRGRNDATAGKQGTTGASNVKDPLGPAHPGSVCLPPPQPPTWKPADSGAGVHGSESPSLKTRAAEVAAEGGAHALAGKWPDASRNLLHFLGNSGKPLEQDVNKMLGDVPRFASNVQDGQRKIGELAVERAQASGAKGPVTFAVNTSWQGTTFSPNDSSNWFYALGSVSWNQTGQVTAYPPAKPGGDWTYKVDTQVNVRDQYNWDGGKATQIGPLTVTDEQLAEMHRGGLAQEFLAYGTSSTRHLEGSAPP